jgi:hypothetical protein
VADGQFGDVGLDAELAAPSGQRCSRGLQRAISCTN